MFLKVKKYQSQVMALAKQDFLMSSVLKICLWALILELKREKAVVWDPNSRLPVAIRFAKEVIQQAITNMDVYNDALSLVNTGYIANRTRKRNVGYGNKLIIFYQDRYAIFDAYEVFILCGRNVLMPTGVPEKVTPEDILRKYGVQIE